MRINQRGAIGPVEIGLIAVLLIFAGFVVWRITESDNSVNDSATNSINASQAIPTAPESRSAPDNETSQPNGEEDFITDNAEEITLTAVNDYEATGTASRAFDETGYTHEVIMQAPDPAEGKFYEGWIVGPSIVSTGELTSEGGGQWSLEFDSEEDLSKHLEVVITEETLADGLDGKPETHVMEGTFSN